MSTWEVSANDWSLSSSRGALIAALPPTRRRPVGRVPLLAGGFFAAVSFAGFLPAIVAKVRDAPRQTSKIGRRHNL